MTRLLPIACLAALLTACTDPQAKNPEEATAAIRKFGQNLSAANEAETLDERIEQSRAAAQRLASVPGSTSEQQMAASLLAARGFVQTAAFDLQKVDELMAQDRTARAAIAATLPDMVVAGAALQAYESTNLDSIAADLARLATSFEAQGAFEGIDAVALAGKAEELKAASATLQATAETRLAEARERIDASRADAPLQRLAAGDEALALTIEGRGAARDGMVSELTYEALAAAASELAALADADEHLGDGVRRAAEAVAAEAARLKDAAADSAQALETMATAVADAAKEIATRRGEALKAAFDAVTQDLDQAATNAGRAASTNGPTGQSARNEQATIALLQARLAQARAASALADAALADMAAKAGDVAEGLELGGDDPVECVSAAVTAYKAAKEAIDGGTESEESKAAMKAHIDGAIKALEDPQEFASSRAGAPSEGADGATDGARRKAPRRRAASPAQVSLPEPVGFESAEALLEAMKASTDSVEGFDRFAHCLSGRTESTRRDGQVMGTLTSAMGPLMVAMKTTFGTDALSGLGDAAAGAADASNASLSDVTDTEATLVSNSQNLKIFKEGDAWFVDVGSMPQDPMNSPMMKQLGAQIGMIAGPMREAAESVAAKVTAGEIADPGAAMQAFQQAMMAAVMKAGAGALGGMAMPEGAGDQADPPEGAGDMADPPEGDQDEPLP